MVSTTNSTDIGMDIINYTELRSDLKNTMERVCNDHIPIAITRKGGAPVVMMSLADYNSERETAYLLSSENNRKRLLSSIKNVKLGKHEEKELIED